MVAAGFTMVAAIYPLITVVLPLYAGDEGFATLAPKFLVIVLIAVAGYIVPCYVLRLDEAKLVAGRTREIIIRSLNLT